MTRDIDEIIVHCSATRASWMAGRSVEDRVREIRRWHVGDNGWRDIGYHWIVDRDGSVAPGRAERVAGAHCRGRNGRSIGICLIGGHGSARTDTFRDHYTPEQDRALREVIGGIRSRHGDAVRLRGHNEYSAKACPGFDVRRWFDGSAPPGPRTSPAQSTTIQATATQVAAAAGTGATAVAALDGTAQIVALALAGTVALAAIWIARERLRRWAAGDR